MGVSIWEGGKAERVAAALETLAENATARYYTLIVTALTKDNVSVTGQVVTVREGSKDGPVYKTAAYEGQPVSISLPEGFHYYVTISDNLYRHFNPSWAQGIIAGADAAVTLYYSDLSHIQTAADIQSALDSGADLRGLVGMTITCAKGNGTLTWEVADVTDNDVTLLLYDTLPDQMQFDKPQALAWFESGLSAGNYKFKHSNTYYYFTLAQDIPAGGQLRATTSVFETYASPTSSEAVDTGTVSTTEISGATDLGTTESDSGTYPLNHMDRVLNGSNNMVEGPLNAWLNGTMEGSTPIPSLNKFARAYVVNFAGFMADIDPDFLAVIANTTWKCATNTTYEAPAVVGGVCTKGQRYSYQAKFSLASEKEIFGVQTGTSVEAGDAVFALYKNATNADRIKRYNNSARGWWLRSPYSYAHRERHVYTSGAVNYGYATNAYGVVPACKIVKSA